MAGINEYTYTHTHYCQCLVAKLCLIFQVRILEWIAISFSRASSRPRDRIHISCICCTGRGIFTTVPPGKPINNVCVCMFVCMYVCVCVCICVCVYIYTHVYTYIYINVYTYICIHTCVCICVYIYIYITHILKR